MLFDARYDLTRENMNGDIDYTYGYDCGDYERPLCPTPACQTPAGPPIVHSPQIRCITRQIVHEVPHV